MLQDMIQTVRVRKVQAILIVAGLSFVVTAIFYMHGGSYETSASSRSELAANRDAYIRSLTPPFDIVPASCEKLEKPKDITDVGAFADRLQRSDWPTCYHLRTVFKRIYHIRAKVGTIVISPSFMSKVSRWLKGDKSMIEASKKQDVVFVDNLVSAESVVFNPVRANRPGGAMYPGEEALIFLKQKLNATKADCDFCKYKQFTAMDTFGRMETDQSVIVSNTFKIDKYHALLLWKQHDPLSVTQEQWLDGMYNSLDWFEKTRKGYAPDSLYRMYYMDAFGKASASQIHTHAHLMVGDYAYAAKWDYLHRVATKYAQDNPASNYWTDLLLVHQELGLAVTLGESSAFAYITPQKDFELVVIARNPSLDFYRMCFFAVKALQVDMRQYAISWGIVLPVIGANSDVEGSELPAILRVTSRGPADGKRADVAAIDLFGTGNVNADPFKVAEMLKKSIKKRSSERIDLNKWKKKWAAWT